MQKVAHGRVVVARNDMCLALLSRGLLYALAQSRKHASLAGDELLSSAEANIPSLPEAASLFEPD